MSLRTFFGIDADDVEATAEDIATLENVHQFLDAKLIKHVYYRAANIIKLGCGRNDNEADICITKNGVEFYDPRSGVAKKCMNQHDAKVFLLRSIGLTMME